MRGHIRKRGKKYCVVVDIGRDESGKRVQKWYSYNTEKEAERALADKIAKIMDGNYVPPSEQTVAQFLNEWLEDKKSTVKLTTWEGYQSKVVHHVIPYIGHLKLKDLRTHQIHKMLSTIRQGGRYDNRDIRVSEQTVLHIYRITNDAFKCAVNWGLIAQNPCDGVQKPRPKSYDADIWTLEQAQTFLNHCIAVPMYPVFLLLFSTGMRIGEILGLRWKDVNFEDQIISVKKDLARTKEKGLVIQDVKTEASKRILPMPIHVVNVLQGVKLLQEKHKRVLGNAYDSSFDLVCCTIKGTPYFLSNIKGKWNAITLRAQLPRIRIHDARHTYASIMVHQGVDVKTLQSLMGHADPLTTLKVYAKVMPDATREAVNTFSQNLTLKDWLPSAPKRYQDSMSNDTLWVKEVHESMITA